MKKYDLTVFIFRRDLRLEDNTGLIEALRSSNKVLPCFIFDANQFSERNAYRSLKAIQFMIESLEDLSKQLKDKEAKLYLFEGEPHNVIEDLIKELKIEAVFVNRDYTPYSRDRDFKIEKICNRNGVKFESYGDCLLNEPEIVKTTQGKPYSIFSAFFRASLKFNVLSPQKNKFNNYFTERVRIAKSEKLFNTVLPSRDTTLTITGGRTNGLKKLKNLKKFKDYKKERDFLTYETTLLSAHNKFGTCSIREVYDSIIKQLSSDSELVRELYWRDYFTHIAWHFPYVFGEAFHEKYNKLPWVKDNKKFKAWCDGKTGFPIVDAGMRQLNKTGFMHNRARLITASFLTKDLHIDWRLGEKYFAQHLIDYDPAVNNGNWQWTASTGADAQPYFRIFNPWLQQKKFDPDCIYIKTWIPELEELQPRIIHNWFREDKPLKNYPLPIIDHSIEANRTLEYFRKIAKKS